MMNYYGWRMGGPVFGAGWLLGIIFWVALGLLFILLIKRLMYHKSEDGVKSEPGGETALDILKKRYAKGEISSKEFGSMKKEIE
jgi:putative membrane protein